MSQASLSFSHLGLFVADMERMVGFYTRILGFVITDRGLLSGTTPITFLSRDPREHHQIVLVAGRPPDLPSRIVNQISFRLDRLEALQDFHRFLAAEQVPDLTPINHGNAWAVYFSDPEGNRIEAFVDTDWYVEQPCREPLDLDRPPEDVRRETEAFCRARPGFRPIEDWRAEVAAKIAARRQS